MGAANASYVLIVGRGEEYSSTVADTLKQDGWDVRFCPGPPRTTCPLEAGKNCRLRDEASATIIYVDPFRTRKKALPLVRCAATSSPALVVLEGQVDAPRWEGESIVVGSLRPHSLIPKLIRALPR